MFKMRPHQGTMWLAIVVLLMGVMAFFDGHLDPGDIPAQNRSYLILMICIVVFGVLMIVATSRMWFKHLWHTRYDRKGRNTDKVHNGHNRRNSRRR